MKRGLLVVALMFAALMHAQNNSPLCFTARNGSVTVRFNIRNVTHTIQYSTDGSSWSTYASGSSGVTIGANQSVYFRAETNQDSAVAFGINTSVYSHFSFSSSNGGTVEGSGNIMSLYGPDCPDLPLQPHAFANMFINCESLTQAPALPATNLAYCCYNGMFWNCSSLVVNTEAPGKEWMIQAVDTVIHALTDMFTGTGGTMNGTPSVNTTYYIASDPTTAAEDVEVEHEYIVFTEGNGIVVNGAAEVSICDASGRVVFDGKVEDEMARFVVPVAGVYFVRCDGKETYRIVVK